MSALVLARTTIRTYSAIIAQGLAIALAVAIPLSNSLTTVISVLLALTCIIYMDVKTWSRVLKHPVTIAILIFVALNLLDITYSIAAAKEISLTVRKSTRLLYFLLLLPIFAQAKLRHLACIGFLATIFVAVSAAIYVGDVVFKDTIFTSLFVAFAIFMLAHYSWEFRQYRWFTILLALFFTFYLLFMGHGRAGQLLFIMLSMLFIWQRVPRTFKQQAGAGLILAVIIAASLLTPSSFVVRNTQAMREIQEYMHLPETAIAHETSLGIRLTLAHNAWELIKLKPIFGWGTGSFAAAYAKSAPEAQVKAVQRTNPHNQYLLTWVELGLAGLLSLLGIFFSAAWLFLRSKRFSGYLGAGLVAAMLAGCCMNSWLLDFTSAFFFVYFAAVFAGADVASLARNQ